MTSAPPRGDVARYTRADLASAQVAAAYDAAVDVVNGHDDYDQHLCCNGTGRSCQGGSVHESIRHYIRTLTPDDAKAKLDAMLKAERARGADEAYARASELCRRGDIIYADSAAAHIDHIRALAKEDGE